MNDARPWTAIGPRAHRYGIVGCSRGIRDVIDRVEQVATARSTVLITGETGTGKELVASAVHQCSAERDMPFVRVNCAAIPDALLESELFGHVRGAFTDAVATKRGKFALANGGTIFLDEIGTMSAGLQAKLLRVLQEREVEPLGAERPERVDVRVIAATNRNLAQLVAQGRFQADLYYRLHVIPIVVPPLRERADDIAILAQHFTEKHAKRCGRSIDAVAPDVLPLLEAHDWPGNVRELENTIERAVVLTTGSTMTREAVTIERARADRASDQPSLPSLNLRENVEWAERETIRRALERAPARRDAAALMGITPRALAYYLNKYALAVSSETG